MGIRFDDKTPIYIQIMDYIKQGIVSGKLNRGDKLPSVREMATKFRVNPNTLQRAYQELERQGITYTQRGTGTFVKEDENMVDELKNNLASNIVNSFIEGMKKIGFSNEDIIKVISKKLKEENN
ncbi:GntR family transcriptional regulator [Clostridium rectalis]|uniref:GntR family transcriptional regulator n=1 Tax=Clostridium rectalis TaxID=2040295 RepID=UPI000F630537|nr:GntR family transcriptional regulator [Clostridium rectalis]